jgi:hypothetical protein
LNENRIQVPDQRLRHCLKNRCAALLGPGPIRRRLGAPSRGICMTTRIIRPQHGAINWSGISDEARLLRKPRPRATDYIVPRSGRYSQTPRKVRGATGRHVWARLLATSLFLDVLLNASQVAVIGDVAT